MRRLLIVIFALLLSPALWASRGRPVSDFRFEGFLQAVNGFVASDGKDFLFLSSVYVGSASTNPQVYVQRVVVGTPAGPSLEIGAGTAAGIVWTGIDYLVSWSTPAGMWTAHVSRQGAFIEGSKSLVVSHAGSLASNGQSILAAARIDAATVLAQPIDVTGRPSGPGTTLNLAAAWSTTLGPSANGFAIVSTGSSNTSVWRLRPDGTPLSASPVILEGPYDVNAGYRSDQSLVATDGTDTLVVFTGEKDSTDTQLKTVIIGPDGTVKRAPRTVYTMAGMGPRSLQPAAVVWTGSEYVISLFVSKDRPPNFGKGDTGLLRINRTGDVVDVISYATSGERRKVPIGLGWNGSQLLVPWYDTDNQQGYGSACAVVPIATMVPSAPAALGRTLSAQSGLTIAASDGQYLAAWFETGAVTTVRASRIDREGNFLDGEGIVLAIVPPPPRFVTYSVAIDSDGTNWLVVWGSGAVRGRRLSRAGALLDPAPFPIALGGSDVAVRWTGSNYVVVAANDSLMSAAVGRDGAVTQARTLASSTYGYTGLDYTYTTYSSPSLAVVRGETLAVYLKVVNTCGGIQSICNADQTILGLRLNSFASPIDDAPFPITTHVWSGPAIASDGTRHLVTWSAYDPASSAGSLFGAFLSADAPQQSGTPFRILSKAAMEGVAFDGSDFLVTWHTSASPVKVGTARISPSGASKDVAMLPLDDAESAISTAIATSPGMPAVIGYLDLHPVYDSRWRGALLFNSEFAPSGLAVPSAPSITGALRIDQNTIDVRWRPAGGAIGTSVELQLEDGSYRTIGVAGGGAASARFSLAGLQGTAVRLRAWNAAGLSEASASVLIAPPRQHAVRPR